jgi:hypothetical protein
MENAMSEAAGKASLESAKMATKADAEDAAGEKNASREPRRIRKTMKDDCFGPRRADATHWRCKRLEGDRRQTLLFWGDNDVEESEWPIETLSLETLRERWGGGRYVVEFYGTNPAGARVQRGKSSIVHLRQVEHVIDFPKAQPVAPQASIAPGLAAASGGDLQTVISLLAFLEDRNEKSRAAAGADAKVSLERYRVDVEAQLQRERLASQERIAQLEAMHKGMRMTSGSAAPFDAESFAAKLGDHLGDRVAAALDEREPPESNGPRSHHDRTADMVKTVTDALAPILALAAAKLGPPVLGGGGGPGNGRDPSGNGESS